MPIDLSSFYFDQVCPIHLMTSNHVPAALPGNEAPSSGLSHASSEEIAALTAAAAAAAGAAAAASTQELFMSQGFRISTRKLVGAALAVVLIIVFWALFITTTSLGTALETGTRAAIGISKIAGTAPAYVNVDIEPIRHTQGSILSQEITQMAFGKPAASKYDNVSGILLSSHGPETVMSFQENFAGVTQNCKVRVSAQAFDHVGTPYAALLARIGSREDGFLLLLTHELAHCYWNPGPIYEHYLNASKDSAVTRQMLDLMPLVLNIMESYGDAYSLLFAARFDRNLYERSYQALIAHRAAKGVPSDIYNTLGAIEVATELAPTLPASNNALNSRWDITHRYVMSAALSGAMKWLMAQGVSRDDAVERIKFVMRGQDVEFSLRTVKEKEYLIVSKVPEITPKPS